MGTNTLNIALNGYNRIGEPLAPRPVTVEQCLTHLRMDLSWATDPVIEAEMNAYIDTAVKFGEDTTKRTFRQSNFKAYWDRLYGGNYPYEVRKMPLASITSLSYNVDGTTEVFDISTIEIKQGEEEGFSRIQPVYGEEWPCTSAEYVSLNNAELNFVAGYAGGQLPAGLKTAILMHVAAMWSNRGDCVGSSNGGSMVPCAVNTIYQQHTILDLWVGA